MAGANSKFRVSEAASLLDVHRRTVLDWITTGKLRASRAGERCMWLIEAEDLRAVLRPNIPVDTEGKANSESNTR